MTDFAFEDMGIEKPVEKHIVDDNTEKRTAAQLHIENSPQESTQEQSTQEQSTQEQSTQEQSTQDEKVRLYLPINHSHFVVCQYISSSLSPIPFVPYLLPIILCTFGY